MHSRREQCRAWLKDQWGDVCKMEVGGAVHVRREKGPCISCRHSVKLSSFVVGDKLCLKLGARAE